MDKKFILEQIKLLSALESWAYATKERLPEYLHERIDDVMSRLQEELLK